MVLKASLITLLGVVTFGLHWAACMEHQFIFSNLSDLSNKVEPVLGIWDVLLLFDIQKIQGDLVLVVIH